MNAEMLRVLADCATIVTAMAAVVASVVWGLRQRKRYRLAKMNEEILGKIISNITSADEEYSKLFSKLSSKLSEKYATGHDDQNPQLSFMIIELVNIKAHLRSVHKLLTLHSYVTHSTALEMPESIAKFFETIRFQSPIVLNRSHEKE